MSVSIDGAQALIMGEAAQYLGVSRPTLTKKLDLYRLHSYQIGTSKPRYVKICDLEYIKAQMHTPSVVEEATAETEAPLAKRSFGDIAISEEEAAALLEYLDFLRWRKTQQH